MTNQHDEESIYRDILDQILYRDPPDAIQQTEISGGMVKMVEIISFADGSRLAVSAQVSMPPLADMTPERIFYLKANGEKGERWDDGSNEAMGLARQSVALRLMEKISRMLNDIPEREKIPCPACEGEKHCRHCHGDGCGKCDRSGMCLECSGRGVIADL